MTASVSDSWRLVVGWRVGSRRSSAPNNWRGQISQGPEDAWVYDAKTEEWYLANLSRYDRN